MQNERVVSRGALLIIFGAAVIAISYLRYQRYGSYPAVQPHGKLHRSNAVRRRSRHGSPIRQPQHDTITRAFEHLRQRELIGSGYGSYTNKHYVTEELIASGLTPFVLLPSRLSHIIDTISDTQNLSPQVKSQLALHIQAMFIQNFFRSEFSDNYSLGRDTNVLLTRFEAPIDTALVQSLVELHDQNSSLIDMDMIFHDQSSVNPTVHFDRPEQLAAALTAAGNLGDQEDSDRTRRNNDEDMAKGGNILDLLYRIAEEQAKWSGYQHKGVECNACGMQPIRGIRYHCANCWDYDLCEACEHQQIHNKTHVFYKIRIPAPIRGQIKLVQPRWYPSDGNGSPEIMPQAVRQRLLRQTVIDRQELDALYDQFKCIASYHWANDPEKIHLAINRAGFDKYFTMTADDRPPTPNLIYDRIFRFYDKSNNGFITFPDFVHGMTELANNHTREARIRRLFKAFDLDEDDFVTRLDFLRMLRAHQQLNKEQTYELIYSREDTILTTEEIEETVISTNPISAVFGGSNFAEHRSRHGQGKRQDKYGDLVLDEDDAPLIVRTASLKGSRLEAIKRQALKTRSTNKQHQLHNGAALYDEPVINHAQLDNLPDRFRREQHHQLEANSGNQHNDQNLRWPPNHIVQEDVNNSLGPEIALETVTDGEAQQRVLVVAQDRLKREIQAEKEAVEQMVLDERWERRDFYQTADGECCDSSADVSGAVSNNVTENVFDSSTEQVTSSQRWAGLNRSPVDPDMGVEILYEAVEEAFNEMLDYLFKDEEDRAVKARASREARKRHAYHSRVYEHADDKAIVQHSRPNFKEAVSDGPEVVESPSSQRNEGERLYADPTLPHHRPNDTTTHTISAQVPESHVGFDEEQLAEWHHHNLTDEKAQVRGGYGRLNLKEIKRKFQDEEFGHVVNEQQVKTFWEAKADLGRFSFLSSWIEMGSF